MKWDHFYEGLSPNYQGMLAHKVDVENPVDHSELLLAAQKLERWAEAGDPLLPKNHYYQEFKCNSFPYTRQSISMHEVEGWPHLHSLIHSSRRL